MKIIIIFIMFYSFNSFCQGFYEEGMKKYNNDKNDSAIFYFSEAISNNVKIQASYKMRGATYLYLNMYSLARYDIKKSISLDSNDYEAFFYYAKLFLLEKKLDSSIYYYNVSLMLDSNDSRVYAGKSACRNYMGNLTEALKDIEKAINLEPSKSTYYNTRGFIYFQLSRYNDAIVNYEKSIKLKPNQKAYANLGLLCFNINKIDKAIFNFSQSLLIEPNDKIVLYYRALSYLEKNEKKLACLDFTKSLELGNNNSKIKKKLHCN